MKGNGTALFEDCDVKKSIKEERMKEAQGSALLRGSRARICQGQLKGPSVEREQKMSTLRVFWCSRSSFSLPCQLFL